MQRRSLQLEIQSNKLIQLYNTRLEQAVALFYEEVGDNEEHNLEVFENFSLAWKKTAHAVNRIQKHTTIDPRAFENQIEKYKQIALQKAIKLQENGQEQHESIPETE